MSHILLMLKRPGPASYPQLDQAYKLLADLSTIKQPVWESDEEFQQRLDEQWVRAVGILDDFLEEQHRRHIQRVKDAGASGI